MKTLLTILAFLMISGYAITPGRATITVKPIPVQTGPLYKCKASSYHAWGVGLGPSRIYAARRALVECANRTPYGDRCYVDWCRRIR